VNKATNNAGGVACCVVSLELDVNTFRGDLELAALENLDRLDGSVTCAGLGLLDLLDDVVALEDLAEDDVLAIEPPVIVLLVFV
jgi:hypothetical protein